MSKLLGSLDSNMSWCHADTQGNASQSEAIWCWLQKLSRLEMKRGGSMQLALPAEEQPCFFFVFERHPFPSRHWRACRSRMCWHKSRSTHESTRTCESQMDRIAVGLRRPVRPVSRVSLESVVSRDKYHTYMVKSGKIYEQTSKG